MSKHVEYSIDSLAEAISKAAENGDVEAYIKLSKEATSVMIKQDFKANLDDKTTEKALSVGVSKIPQRRVFGLSR